MQLIMEGTARLLEGIFRVAVHVGRILRLGFVRRLVRNAWWKARLQAMGDESTIYPFVMIHEPEHVRIGARCAIAEFVHIWGSGGITIGNDVLIASHAAITSVTHDPKARCFRETTVRKAVEIGDNVWIGAGAIILPGISIGMGSIIGAGAVVTKSVPPGTLIVGVPGKANTEHLPVGKDLHKGIWVRRSTQH